MKHIVYVIEDIARVGGRESITLAKAQQLANLGYQVSILSHRQSAPVIDAPDISFIDLNIDSGLLDKREFNRQLRRQITHHLQIVQADIFICMVDRGLDVYMSLSTSAKKIVEIHGSHDFYYNFIGRKSGFLKKLSKRLRARRLRKKLMSFDKAVILFEKDMKKWDLNNSVTIPNFFASEQQPQDAHYFSERFISAGRLSYEKGFDLLLDIWKELRNQNIKWHLDIYGDGDEKERLLQQINKLDLQNWVKIHPFCDDLSSRYHQYCSYLLPSRCEAFPMVVLESFACGLPVIAFASKSGVREMIKNNTNGMLIPSGNVKEFAKAVIIIQAERAVYSAHAKQSGSDYQPTLIMQKWTRLFDELGNYSS